MEKGVITWRGQWDIFKRFPIHKSSDLLWVRNDSLKQLKLTSKRLFDRTKTKQEKKVKKFEQFALSFDIDWKLVQIVLEFLNFWYLKKSSRSIIKSSYQQEEQYVHQILMVLVLLCTYTWRDDQLHFSVFHLPSLQKIRSEINKSNMQQACKSLHLPEIFKQISSFPFTITTFKGGIVSASWCFSMTALMEFLNSSKRMWYKCEGT